MSRPLLIPVGDPAGVGPAVAIEAARALSGRAPMVLFGDGARLRHALGTVAGVEIVDVGAVDDATVDARAPTAAGGRAQLAALDRAIDEALAGRGRAIVTGPTSKEAVHLAGAPFIGQTEHLARRAGLADDDVTMMFLGPRLNVSLATTHLAIAELPRVLSERHVRRALDHLVDALSRLGLERPRVAVGALNPHAGEGGAFGTEDRDVIAPVARAGSEGADVRGPLGAETAFRQAAAAEVDGVVAMFHDQATIASKLLDWGAAVNVTWGLPFVRTSVDHGVAYDAAAAGTASSDGMRAAIELALRLTEGA